MKNLFKKLERSIERKLTPMERDIVEYVVSELQPKKSKEGWKTKKFKGYCNVKGYPHSMELNSFSEDFAKGNLKCNITVEWKEPKELK